ncbi:unnamed protein product [Somion occarium]|uniref:Chromatin modification-related protein n=1 Tax=Somion occarium TaxID=3059160 RepID=A0ABP1D0F9_9APHY
MSTTNLEEAASVAAEFVSSLDNLPQEVQFLLAEMKHKDTRTQELQQEINNASSKYIRHSVKSANGTAQLSSKDTNIPAIVKANYAEIDRLAAEKQRLSERIVQLITRARARLEHDLNKVLILQGDLEPTIQGSYLAHGTRNPVHQVLDLLKGASNIVSISEVPATPTPTGAAAHPTKRRKLGSTTSSTVSIKLPSPAPVAASSAASSAAASHRSRLSQQVARQSPARQQRSSGRVTASVELEADQDAEGEEDLEENAEDNGEVEDQELYCFCQKLSYGEMVACDNPNCRYQWFHLPCVNLKPPLPHVWYCSECASQFGGVTTTTGTASGGASGGGGGSSGSGQRKGRKK